MPRVWIQASTAITAMETKGPTMAAMAVVTSSRSPARNTGTVTATPTHQATSTMKWRSRASRVDWMIIAIITQPVPSASTAR